MKKMKRNEVTEVILTTVKTLSVLTVATIAPNALRMFDFFDKNDFRKKYYIKTRTKELIEQDYLKFEDRNGKSVLVLTKKGEKQLERFKLFGKNKKPKKWDGKWRVIAYDVWENNRQKRDLFRQELKEFGFKKLQGSVWVYPYDCEDFIKLLKADKGFGNNAKYFLVEKMENDSQIRRWFGLD